MTARCNSGVAGLLNVLAGLTLITAGCGGGSASTRSAAPSSSIATPASTSTTLLPLYVPASTQPVASPPSPSPPLRPISETPQPELPATVDSADGRAVTVADVSRILPLWGNLSEVVFTLGLGPNVVGRDLAATFAEARGLPVVTHGHDVSAESVLSLRPTVVLAQTDTGPPEALEQIRAAGVPVVVIAAPESIDDVATRIVTVSTALGVPELGDALVVRTQAEIAEVQALIPQDVDPPTVAFMYLRGSAGVYLLAGPGSGADSMIAAAGAVDAGTAMHLDRPFTPLTSEALVTAAPDVILMTTTGLESIGGLDGLLAVPGVAQTPAGIDRRVIAVEDGLLYSFGARTAEALREIVTQLYPTAG